MVQIQLESGIGYVLRSSVCELNQNETVAFSGANEYFSKDEGNDYYKFAMTGTIEASGNIMSLLNFSDSCTEFCFEKLFYGCTSLVTPPSLPATGLAQQCYNYLFLECSNISSAP